MGTAAAQEQTKPRRKFPPPSALQAGASDDTMTARRTPSGRAAAPLPAAAAALLALLLAAALPAPALGADVCDVGFNEIAFSYSTADSTTWATAGGMAPGDAVLYKNVATRPCGGAGPTQLDALVTTKLLSGAEVTQYEDGAHAGGGDSYFQARLPRRPHSASASALRFCGRLPLPRQPRARGGEAALSIHPQPRPSGHLLSGPSRTTPPANSGGRAARSAFASPAPASPLLGTCFSHAHARFAWIPTQVDLKSRQTKALASSSSSSSSLARTANPTRRPSLCATSRCERTRGAVAFRWVHARG